MTQFLLAVHDCPKCGVSLQAADQLAQEDLNALPRGPKLLCDVRRPRSVPQHRLLFALIRKVAVNAPTPMSEHALRQWLTVRTGHTEELPLAFGKSYTAARSWAFDKMDQGEFRQLFDDVVQLILTEVCPNLPEGFADEFTAMLETPSEAARAPASANNGAGGLVRA